MEKEADRQTKSGEYRWRESGGERKGQTDRKRGNRERWRRKRQTDMMEEIQCTRRGRKRQTGGKRVEKERERRWEKAAD